MIYLKRLVMPAAVAAALGMGGGSVVADSFTDFESFTTGISVDGQGGWGASGTFDEEVVDDGGNTVWRASNSITSGAFGNQPFAPRPGGIVADPTTDPVNSLPNEFAGETSTGASHNVMISEFKFKSATGSAQPNLSVTVSSDNGSGGRQTFVDIEDNGTGLDVRACSYQSSDPWFICPYIATNLSYTDWHTLRVEATFVDGSNNDVVKYFVNNSLGYTGSSWEEYYRDWQPLLHPFGVPVQTLLFRISGGAEAGVDGGGLFFDNVDIKLSNSPIPVVIDIKPGSDPNSINNDGKGVIPVAILTTSIAGGDALDFDAATVDPSTLQLNSVDVAMRGKNKIMCHIEDVDSDGDDDLVCQFEDEDGMFAEGDSTATVTGFTFGGDAIEGTDSINIVP